MDLLPHRGQFTHTEGPDPSPRSIPARSVSFGGNERRATLHNVDLIVSTEVEAETGGQAHCDARNGMVRNGVKHFDTVPHSIPYEACPLMSASTGLPFSTVTTDISPPFVSKRQA